MALKSFKGGIHPPHNKKLTESKPIEQLPLPAEIVIPLQQHTGAPCRPLVKKGDEVLAGQKVGETDTFVSAPIHSPVAGKIKGIEPRPYFTGKPVLSLVIAAKESSNYQQIKDFKDHSPEGIRRTIREAGIVGLGGAAFPTHVKLSPPKEKPIEAVIINGCECEPYLTADHRQMLENKEALIEGTKLIMKAVSAKRGFIGIEINKPDAIDLIGDELANEENIEVVPLEAKYPQGSEKHLIKAILGRTVPSGGLPMDVGALVQNVGTTISVYRACYEGRPLLDRVVTVTGTGIKEPKNVRTPLGTPVRNLIEFCGGLDDQAVKVVMGGPMMGFALPSLDIPVVKSTSGILVLRESEVSTAEAYPCIKCGECVKVCPMNLIPSRLALLAEHERWEDLEDYSVLDCVECGSCAYVCPARRPLVQLIKVGKANVQAMNKSKV